MKISISGFGDVLSKTNISYGRVGSDGRIEDNMEEKREELIDLVEKAYKDVQNLKFNTFRIKLLQFSKDLHNGGDYIKVMLDLRAELLQADLSLKLKDRISGLPTEYGDIYNFIFPQLKRIDSKVLDRYSRYGFIPLRYGSTVKYSK